MLCEVNKKKKTFATHHADLSSYQVTQSVKPPDISLQVGGFLFLVTETGLLIRHAHTEGEREAPVGDVNILVIYLTQLITECGTIRLNGHSNKPLKPTGTAD